MRKNSNRGQALVEYVLIISLITVLAVVPGEKRGEGKCVSSSSDNLWD